MKVLNSIKLLLTAFALFLGVSSAKASHVPGGNITYECIGPNQYLVTLTLYEDCGTAFTSNTDQYINIENDCGYPNQTSVALQNTIYQQEVSQLCPAQLGNSECNGGTLPGVYEHQWQAVITLPGPCDSWTFSYSSCCRNTSTNVNGQPGYYWESVLNDQTYPCNNSPIINAQPIPYVCVNQLVNYNLGASEPDGHTLVYSFIGAQSAAGTFVTYNGGYTANAPIPGINIDPNTGQITFTPTNTGNYIVAILIEEYDANGNLVGSIIHDVQFEVINCSNVNPDPPAGGITNYSGNGSVIAPDAVEVCEGDSFCFDVEFTDPDAANTLTITSNVTTVLPGATLTQTGTNPATATICWTAQPGMPSFNSFVLTVEDDGCPINGIITYPIEVHIISSTYAGPDVTMCQGVPTQLNAAGGTNFNWTSISGDPIIIGTNFSCNPCQDPVVNPTQTTTYEVTSNLTGGCVNIDTITVTVVPDFTYTMTQSSGNSCLQDPMDVTITPNPTGNYSYDWTSPTGTGNMSCTNCSNPTITETSPGNYTYYVDITSPGGCVKEDSVTLNVAAAYAPNITAMASTDTIDVCGDSVDLDVDLGGGIPATCGPSTSGGCSGATTPLQIGTQSSTNDQYSWPAPYGNWYANSKQQYLFTAAELQAAGFVGGKIVEITWETTAQNGAQTTFNNYEIKMGCTNVTSLTTTFETGLTQVFGPQNVNVALGPNTHTLTTPYEWDGVSNLVVEICYEWTAQYSYTYNWSTPMTTTAFNSSNSYYSDGTAACPNPTGFVTSPERPVTTFTTCPSVPDPNNYSFDWTPATGSGAVDNATIQDPSAAPSYPTWYYVTVTDNNGGCTDTDSVLVFVDCCDPSTVITSTTSCFGSTDGTIETSPQGLAGPFDIEITDNGGAGAIVHTANGVVVGGTDVATGLGGGSYLVSTVDATGCIHDTTVVVDEPDEIITTLSDTTICLDGTATLSASATGGDGGPFTINWIGLGTGTQNVTPTSDTCYDVYIADASGCNSDTSTLCVTVLDSLNIGITAPITEVCPGASVDLDASGVAGGDGNFSYTWDDGTANVGNTAAVTVNPTDPTTTYCVTLSDGCETPDVTECVDVDLFEVPDVSFTSDVVDGCYPVEVNFTNTTALNGDCLWDFGDGTTSTDCNPNHTYDQVGSYDVTLTVTSNPGGCVADSAASQMINVYGYPTADFDWTPEVGTILNPEITFENLSTDNAANEWFFGTNGILGTSTDENPEFAFPNNNPGTYNVDLVVTNQFGCTDTVSATVIINGIFTFYAPNAFTPDGDGINDVFLPQGDGVDVTEYELTIFNRWGEIVFQTDDINQGWDGTYNGFQSKEDVYVWKITAKDRFDGSQKEFVGHVTLLR